MPEHRRVLGWRRGRYCDSDDHDHGRHLYARLQVLCGQNEPGPATADPEEPQKVAAAISRYMLTMVFGPFPGFPCLG